MTGESTSNDRSEEDRPAAGAARGSEGRDAPAGRRTLRLLLEYDGTDFAGWQEQPRERTVQGTMEAALRKILDEPGACVVASGRTDSGAHAVGQVAHVRTERTISAGALLAGLNSILPRDVRVRRVEEAPPGFHARFSARAKEYRYHVWHASPVPPFLRSYCYAVRSRLDVTRMAEAAALFVGTQDLSAFRASHCTARTPMRTVYEARVAEHGSLVVVSLRAKGFLQHMARIISGTLVRVGRGLLLPADVSRLIASRDRRLAPPTAPAHGLFLVRVEYDDPEGRLVASADPVITCLSDVS